MPINLEQILRNHFFKEISITFESGANMRGYLVGIKLPINDLLMLYLVESKHIEKFIKNGSKRWRSIIPHELICGIKNLNADTTELEEDLEFMYMQLEEGTRQLK